MRNGFRNGWPLERSEMGAECCTLRGAEFCDCCAEMVACGEGKKCHNPSGDSQQFSFEASHHRLSYERTEKWPCNHIPIREERGVGARYVHPQPA